SRAYLEIAAHQQTFWNFAAPTIASRLHWWPVLLWQVRLICPKNRCALRIHQIEPYTEARNRSAYGEIEFDITILIAIKSTARLALRVKHPNCLQRQITVPRS